MSAEVGIMDVLKECRACLLTLEGVISQELFKPWPFHWFDKETLIANDLAELTNIEISESDNYSKVICIECFNRLQDAIRFRVMVRKCDAWLKENVGLDDNSKMERPVPNAVGKVNWPQPINIYQHLNGSIDNKVEVEVKQEVLSEDDNDFNDTDMWQEPMLDIKVEPEEMITPDIAVEISGSYSLTQGDEDVLQNNTCEDTKSRNETSTRSKNDTIDSTRKQDNKAFPENETNNKNKNSKYSRKHENIRLKGDNVKSRSKNSTSDDKLSSNVGTSGGKISSTNSTRCEEVCPKICTINVIATSESDGSEYTNEEYLDTPLNKTVKEEPIHDADNCSDSDSLTDAVECILCMTKFKDLLTLKAHVESNHSYQGIKRNTVQVPFHTKKAFTETPRVHLCLVCRKTFRSRLALLFHKRRHDRHACVVCSATCATAGELARHRRRCREWNTMLGTRSPNLPRQRVNTLPPSVPKVRLIGNTENTSHGTSKEKKIKCKKAVDNLVEENMASLFREINEDGSELAQSIKIEHEDVLETVEAKPEPTTDEINEQTREIERVLSTDDDIKPFSIEQVLKDVITSYKDTKNPNMEVHLEINPILDNPGVLDAVQKLKAEINNLKQNLNSVVSEDELK